MTSLDFWLTLRYNSILNILYYLAKKNKQRLWLVGGPVRDLLLGVIPLDLDLAVNNDALNLGLALASKIGGRFVLLKKAFASCRVIITKGPIRYLDLTNLRAINIEADLIGRDFTINALAIELENLLTGHYHLIDPSNGQADIIAKTLRPVGPNVLVDDPLRVLRAFRFIATHGLSPAPGVVNKLAAAAPGLFRVARERLGQEWRKLMAGSQAGLALNTMEQAQILTRLLPELAQGRGIEQNPFHHLNVFQHNLACVSSLEQISSNLLGTLATESIAHLKEEKQRVILKTAALLHDLGKPKSRQYKEAGWYSFHRHDIIGANIALHAVRRLGFAKNESKQIVRLIREHMRPFHLLGAFNQGNLTSRAIRRLLVAVGPDLAALLLLSLADTMAGHGPQRPAETEKRLLQLWKTIINMRDSVLAQSLQAPRLINGQILMQELGLAPGVEVGRILTLVHQAQLDGIINDTSEALLLARRLWNKKQKTV